MRAKNFKTLIINYKIYIKVLHKSINLNIYPLFCLINLRLSAKFLDNHQ